MELPNQGYISTLVEKENHKYLGILEVDTLKQTGMEKKEDRRTSERNYF